MKSVFVEINGVKKVFNRLVWILQNKIYNCFK